MQRTPQSACAQHKGSANIDHLAALQSADFLVSNVASVNRDRQHTGSDAKQRSDDDASKTLQMPGATGIDQIPGSPLFAYLNNLDADFY
jgi:hypothetical protein